MAENGPFLKSKKRVRKHFCEKFLIFNSVLTFMTKILVVRFFGEKETSEMTETTFGKNFFSPFCKKIVPGNFDLSATAEKLLSNNVL